MLMISYGVNDHQEEAAKCAAKKGDAANKN